MVGCIGDVVAVPGPGACVGDSGFWVGFEFWVGFRGAAVVLSVLCGPVFVSAGDDSYGDDSYGDDSSGRVPDSVGNTGTAGASPSFVGLAVVWPADASDPVPEGVVGFSLSAAVEVPFGSVWFGEVPVNEVWLSVVLAEVVSSASVVAAAAAFLAAFSASVSAAIDLCWIVLVSFSTLEDTVYS